MAQDPYGLGIKPLGGSQIDDPYNLGIKPIQPQPQQKPELSGLDWWVSQGLRTIPAVAGGLVGGIYGAVPGAMAGGAGGSALGNLLGQGYEGLRGYREEFNPYEFGLETGLGAIPPILGPTKPLASAGLAQIAKYGLKSAGSGAIEGALISGAATPFQNWAQGREFGATIPEVAQSAGAGAIVGGVTGGGLGTYFGHRQARGLEAIANAPPPPPTPVDLTPPPIVKPKSPAQIQNEAAIAAYRERLKTTPAAPAADEIRDAHLIPPADIAAGVWEPHGINPTTQKAQMIKRGTPLPEMEALPAGEEVGGATTFDESQGFTVPKEDLTPENVQSNVEAGYKLVGYDPNGGGIFKQLLEGEEATFDPQQMWTNLKRLLGRDPTPEEVDRGMARQPGPGETTGRVAQFEPKGLRESLSTQDLQRYLADTSINDELRREIVNLLRTRGVIPHPDYSPISKNIYEGWNWNQEGQLPTEPIQNLPNEQNLIDDTQPTPRPGPRLVVPEEGGLDVSRTREQNVLEPRPEDYEPQEMRRGPTREQMQATDEGYAVLPPGYEGPFDNHVVIRTLADGSRVIDPRRTVGGTLYEPEIPPKTPQELRDELRRERLGRRIPEEPQEMRVPGWKEGKGGLENVAGGPASSGGRLWDVMGSSLYTRPRPITTIKELLQNAWDEHKEFGIQDSVRVLIDSTAPNPRSGGPTGKSITVRDRGRGLGPEEIYTVLTNLGETGKEGVTSAAGGFGLAKAAPFAGGKYFSVRSVVDTPKGRMLYTFGGTPAEFKNQARGVPLNAEKVGADIPTGLEVTTFYDANIPGFYEVASWAQNMAERSPSVETPTKIVSTYGADPAEARRWLDESPQNPIGPKEYNYLAKYEAKDYSAQPMPTLMDTITTPGAEVKIHYDIEPGVETSEANLHLTNKGMYQGSNRFGYGEQTANVPKSIVADIVATVEEGVEGYPFGANREQISDDVSNAIDKWVKDNIITGVTQKRIAEIQKMYDGIGPIPSKNVRMDYLDEGNLLTPEELNKIVNHPRMTEGLRALKRVHDKMLDIADTLGWTPESYGATWTKPSQRLKKFGLLFKAPDNNGTVLGIHIPRPDDLDNSAVLFNLMEHLNNASKHTNPIDQFTTAVIATLAHEDAHIPGGPHDKGHSYRDADLRSKFGADNTVDWFDEIGGWLDDGQGGINPEILELLQIYNTSRTRATGGPNALLATGISSTRFPDTGEGTSRDIEGIGAGEARPQSLMRRFLTEEEGSLSLNPKDWGWGQGGQNAPVKPKVKRGQHAPPTFLENVISTPTAVTTVGDFTSAVGRQGISSIHTPEFWSALGKLVKGGALTKKSFNQAMAPIYANVEFQPRIRKGKVIQSLAEEHGIDMIKSGQQLSANQTGVANSWIETGGNIPGLSAAYRATLGKYAAASNRHYALFLNHLRANRYLSLMKHNRDLAATALQTGKAKTGAFGRFGPSYDYTPTEALELDPYTNDILGKEIADFVNTATGSAPLKMHILPHRQAEISLEAAAGVLSKTMFAPKLMFSRMRMLNPSTYIMASATVRKEYMKAAAATAAAWIGMAKMAEMAGADVSWDPTSADFGKIRIGNTRLDPAGGFQQFIVDYSRIWYGGTTSSSTGQFHRYGEGFRAETLKDTQERFFANKLNPITKFGYDLMNQSQYIPFHVYDRTAQLFVPLVVQDLIELIDEDPNLIPLMIPVNFGMGTQTYEKGESVGKLISPSRDWLATGGGVSDLLNTDFMNQF